MSLAYVFKDFHMHVSSKWLKHDNGISSPVARALTLSNEESMWESTER